MTETQISGGVVKCIVHVEQQNLGTGMVLTNSGNAANNTEDITADIEFNTSSIRRQKAPVPVNARRRRQQLTDRGSAS
jgi:hypothetical protein